MTLHYTAPLDEMCFTLKEVFMPQNFGQIQTAYPMLMNKRLI